MGQISSLFESNDDEQENELDCIPEENESPDSTVHTPLDERYIEDDDLEFEDCNEDLSEEEDNDNRTSGNRIISCLFGNYREKEEDESLFSQEDDELQKEIINHVKEEEKRLSDKNALEQMKDDSPSMKSQLSQSDIAERIGSSHVIIDEDALRIIQELIDGKYNHSIYELWRNIETSDFDVTDFGFTYFLPALILSKLICLYFENGGTQFSDISSYSTLLQNYISEWITINRDDSNNSFISSYPQYIQFLFSFIKDIVYFLNIIEESDKANQYYWILEYIDLARIDPVHVVQNRTKTGKYHKKKGSRYDSNESSEDSVFDLLSPRQSDLSQPTSPDQNDGWKVVGKPARSSHHSPARTDRDYHHRSFSKNANSSTSINSHSSLRRVNSYKENGNHHKYYSSSDFSPSKHHSHQRTTSYHSQGNSHVSEERSESSSSGKLYSISRELRRWSNDDDEEDIEDSLEELTVQTGSSTSWDQFTVNREKFGVETSFDENLYTVPMSSLQMNEQEWKEVVDAAKEMEDEDEAGRSKFKGEINDGEEDAVLYSNVCINQKPSEKFHTEGEIDYFIDRNIGK